MDNIDDEISKISERANLDHLGIPEAVVMLGLGLAVLAFGYRIKKVAFFIIWFIIGFIFMGYLLPLINATVPEIKASDLYQTLLPIAGGILLAFLGFSIEKLCVSGICFALTMFVAIQYFGTEMQVIAIAGIIGIVLGGFAVMMMKPATIVATSVAGAYVIVLALMKINTGLDFDTLYWPLLLGIAAVGSVFQFMTTKRIE